MTTPTREQVVQWEGAEDWEHLAFHLCAEENGEECCNELIWEGYPPEPWGERWLKYESEAKRMIELVKKFSHDLARADLEATVKDQAAEIERLSERRCEICGYAEHHREHTGCLRQQLAAAQLHIEQLRGALCNLEWGEHNYDNQYCPDCGNRKTFGKHTIHCSIGKALSTQPDLSALEAERQRVAEACAMVCDQQKDECRNDTNCWYGAKWCEEAIRAGQWREHL